MSAALVEDDVWTSSARLRLDQIAVVLQLRYVSFYRSRQMVRQVPLTLPGLGRKLRDGARRKQILRCAIQDFFNLFRPCRQSHSTILQYLYSPSGLEDLRVLLVVNRGDAAEFLEMGEEADEERGQCSSLHEFGDQRCSG